MGTIKLRRGSGSPAGSLEQYEVAMDVADKNLYVSTDGSDAVILADNTENFLGTNTTELDITSDIDMNGKSILNAKQIKTSTTVYNEVSAFERVNNFDYQSVASLEVERDMTTSALSTGLDERGVGFSFTIKQDSLPFFQNSIYPGIFFGKSGGSGQLALVENTVGMSVYSGPNDTPAYTEIPVFDANRNNATLYQNTLIEGSATNLTTPVLHLKTDNSNWFTGQLLCSDSNGKVFTQVGRHNTGIDTYQWNISLDPDNNNPRQALPIDADQILSGKNYEITTSGNTDFTLIGAADSNVGTTFTATGAGTGTGTATYTGTVSWAGDNFVDFQKSYATNGEMEMRHRIFGAHNGYAISVRGDYDGGTVNQGQYKYKQLNLNAKETNFNCGENGNILALTVEEDKISPKVPIAQVELSSDPSNPANGWTYYIMIFKFYCEMRVVCGTHNFVKFFSWPYSNKFLLNFWSHCISQICNFYRRYFWNKYFTTPSLV